jgi:hypothetical protein
MMAGENDAKGVPETQYRETSVVAGFSGRHAATCAHAGGMIGHRPALFAACFTRG